MPRLPLPTAQLKNRSNRAEKDSNPKSAGGQQTTVLSILASGPSCHGLNQGHGGFHRKKCIDVAVLIDCSALLRVRVDHAKNLIDD